MLVGYWALYLPNKNKKVKTRISFSLCKSQGHISDNWKPNKEIQLYLDQSGNMLGSILCSSKADCNLD